jgi:hypothetical protein
MKSKLDNISKYSRLIFQRMTKDSDSRALFLLAFVGVIIGIIWWLNATLVYDDVILIKDLHSFGFQYITVRDGWFGAFMHFLLLDLPDQYRTYGLARASQFLLWTFGISSAHSYSVLISFFHVVSALALYGLLSRLKFAKSSALASGLIWMLSPFIWTSCFHHYSYTILPTQMLIIGSYLLIKLPENRKKSLLAIAMGIVLGLTGELHLLAVPLVLIAVAIAAKNRAVLRAAILTIISMILAISVHYLLWRLFEANSSMHQRFALSLSHNPAQWKSLIYVAIKSIYFSFVIPLKKLSEGNFAWIATATFFSSLGFFTALIWVDKRTSASQDKLPAPKDWRLAGFLFATAGSYFLIYGLVSVLSNSIPHTMPRRYGFVPLTLILMATCSALAALVSRNIYKKALLSLFLGTVTAFFIWYQVIFVPEIRASNNTLTEAITNELKDDSRKGVLFFNASNKEFPRAAVYPDSLGPSMQDSEGTELTQSGYGTYWPSEMNVTRIIEAPFACDIVGSLDNNKLRTACPYGSVIRDIKARDAIIVANLGFNSSDPFGKHISIFKNFDDFEPYFFSKMIVTDADPTVMPRGDFFSINLNEISPGVKTGTIFPNKDFDSPLVLDPNSWLKNYGWVSKSSESTPEYAFNFSESDVNVYLDFPGKNRQPTGEFEIQVSWNNGAWISLGKLDANTINNSKPFSIRMSHLNTETFKFKLSAVSDDKHIPSTQSIRIEKRELPNPLK